MLSGPSIFEVAPVPRGLAWVLQGELLPWLETNSMLIIVATNSKSWDFSIGFCGREEPKVGKQGVGSDDHGLGQLLQLEPNLEKV